MAKKLEELKGKIEIDKAFQDGYESERVYKETPKVIEKPLLDRNAPDKKIQSEDNENKTKRLHISIRPKLYEDLTKIAFINKISLNEQIARTLQELRDKEQNKIKKYDEI